MTSRRKVLFASAGLATVPLAPTARAQGTSDSTADPATSAAAAEAAPEHTILLEDSRSGVARDYYHYGLRIGWRGSFIGSSLGSVTIRGAGPFTLPLASAPEHLVLRRSGSWVNVYSRESGRGVRLEVTYQDGTSATLACLADSTIDTTSTAPQGAEGRLVFGSSAVLRFQRPARAVRSAQLVGEVISSGGRATLEGFTFVSPLLPEPPVQYGLRQRGLSGPTLIHAADFSAPNWWRPWFSTLSIVPSAAQMPMVETDLDTGLPLGRKAFCIQIAGAGLTPPPLALPLPESPAFNFPRNVGRELEEVYFQYRLRFGEGWRGGSRQSGKLPGVASDTTLAGNGGSTSNGKNGWSFRGLFVGEQFDPNSPYAQINGRVAVGWYTYNPDQLTTGEIFGLHVPWTGRGAVGVLEVGKDYWIDQYVKVNTPGRRDGIVRAWVNGQLAYERTDHVMRGDPPYWVPGNLAIQKIWMTFLHGGDIYPLPVRTLRTYWSDWTIATEYIGPPTLSANRPPAVSITSPAPGASFTAGASVGVTAAASDSDGTISRVEFYADGALVGTRTAAPYTVSVGGLAAGDHTLTAVATDSAGASGVSAAVPIRIAAVANVPPSVAITVPVNGASFAAGASVTMSAQASDSDGSIARVDFYAGGALVGTRTAAPYSVVVAGLANGTHTLSARATDGRGASTTSGAVTIRVGSTANQPPAVNITVPAAGATFASGSTITMQAAATDADGRIVSAQFRVDGAVAALFGPGDRFSAPLTGLGKGRHVLTASVTDDSGATTTSAAVSITVDEVARKTTVTLQEGLNGYGGARDAYLSAWYKDQSMGRTTTLLESGAYVNLLRFAIFAAEGGPVPSGATVTSAVLSIYKTTLYDHRYQAHRLLADWDSVGATWNRARPDAAWASPGAAGAGRDYVAAADASANADFAAGWVEFDVTAGVQAMAAGQRNYGWRLRSIGGNPNEKRFASSEYGTQSLRPKLKITFST